MTKDYLKIDDVSYRVEVNMHTVEEWEKMSGMSLSQFEIESAQSSKTGGVDTRLMLLWLFAAIREGEEIEGRSFDLDFHDFKRIIRPSALSLFAVIFIKQYMEADSVINELESEANKRKKFTFFNFLSRK